MGLGRLSNGDKRPVRGVPFHLDKLRKELCAESLVKEEISVVQYKDEQEPIDKE